MNVEMLFQFGTAQKRFVAMITSMWSLDGMNQAVNFKISFGFVQFSTSFTFKISNVHMESVMT